MKRWRPALRIARRTVLRSRGRSLLIALLVALPVAAATFVDVIVHTFDSPELTAQRTVGSADAAITVTPARHLLGYDPLWLVDQPPEPTQRDPANVDVRALLPRGSRVVAMPRYQPAALKFGNHVVASRILIGDVREPMEQFLLRLKSGSRAPRLGEVLITPRLAERLQLVDSGGRLRPGAAITLVDGPTARVAGLVDDPSCLSCEQVVAPPGSAIVIAAGSRSPAAGYAYQSKNQDTTAYPTYLVDLPPGASADALGRELAAHGIALTTRDALAQPTRYRSGAAAANASHAGGLVTVIVALGLLEVILLAGAAFAVGARRQVRELGLVAAIGGHGRDIRRIILAQGLVLGGLGAVLGVAGGFAVAIFGRPLWERLANGQITGWEFDPCEIAAAALLALFSGLAAAALPAVGASRMLPVNALAGRFRGSPQARRRNSWFGAALVTIGVGCGLFASTQLSAGFAAYERALPAAAVTGRDLNAPLPQGQTTLIIGGGMLAVAGLVLLIPGLISAISRAGWRLPLSARLAVRDAERHRHRTGPAVTAITIAVTCSIALAFLLAGSFHASDLHRQAALPPDTLAVQHGDGSTTTMLRAAALAAAQLPHGQRLTISTPLPPASERWPTGPGGGFSVLSVIRQDNSCPPGLSDPVCSPIAISPGGPIAIGGENAVTRLIAGPGFNAAARRALTDGEVLVFDPTMLDHAGNVHIATPHGQLRLPGHLVHTDRTYGQLPSGLVSAPTARAQAWHIGIDSALVTYGAHASRDAVAGALTAVDQTGAVATQDTGPQKPENLLLEVTAAVAALITLIGVAISIALSVAEGRADLATLAAVGAPPSRHRRLMASQALLLSGLGSALGVGLGTFIAYTARTTTGSPAFVIPWHNLAATGIAVPLLATIVAALCTRGHLPIVHRTD